MIHCTITPTVTLTATITETIRLEVCAPQRVQPPPVEATCQIVGRSTVSASGVCVRGVSAAVMGRSAVSASASAIRGASAVVVGRSVVSASAERIAYPEALPGAFSLLDPQDIQEQHGEFVPKWLDRIRGVDATARNPAVAYTGVTKPYKWLDFHRPDEQRASYNLGSRGDFSFLNTTGGSVFAAFYTVGDVGVPSWVFASDTGGSGAGIRFIITNRIRLEISGGGSIFQSDPVVPVYEWCTAGVSFGLNGATTFINGEIASVHDGPLTMTPGETKSDPILSYDWRGGIVTFFTSTQQLTQQHAAGFHNWALGE